MTKWDGIARKLLTSIQKEFGSDISWGIGYSDWDFL
jgi:hypothetical protein